MTANSDESRILFLDSERLTADSTASKEAGGQDLYEYNLDAPLGARITDLSVDGNAGEHADVAMMLGASSDGSYVYFAAPAALAPGAGPGAGHCGDVNFQAGDTRVCNLYIRHDGVTRLVAALGQEDFPDWESEIQSLAARVSPNGRWLAFMSSRNLTGYDTTDAVSGRPD